MALNAGSEPAEAELRRQRQERLSRAMGELLLRGYRMLGSCCPHCGTILLQDKQQQLLCLGCRESHGLGGTAHSDGSSSLLPCEPSGGPAGEGSGWGWGWGCGEGRGEGRGEGAALGAALGAAREALVAKLRWAARELPRSGSAEASAQLCLLLRACAEALGALQALRPPDPPRAAPPRGTPPAHP